MFILCYEVPINKVDEIIENLQINDIYDVFYESPLEITTNENGYDYKYIKKPCWTNSFC